MLRPSRPHLPHLHLLHLLYLPLQRVAGSDVTSGANIAGSDVRSGANIAGSDVRSGAQAARRKSNSAAPKHHGKALRGHQSGGPSCFGPSRALLYGHAGLDFLEKSRAIGPNRSRSRETPIEAGRLMAGYLAIGAWRRRRPANIRRAARACRHADLLRGGGNAQNSRDLLYLSLVIVDKDDLTMGRGERGSAFRQNRAAPARIQALPTVIG
jgi:hypothetical protein